MKLEHFANAKVARLHPLIVTIDGFVSGADCDRLVQLAKPKCKPATVYADGKGAERSSARTNSWCLLDPAEHSLVKTLISEVGSLVCLPPENAEGVWGLHYRKGERFEPHFDSFATEGTAEHKAILEKCGGQRLYTAICYLNQDYSGGQTLFPNAGITISPKKGTLLLFANTVSGSREPAPASLHAAAPVVEGEKWAATIWWREHGFSYDLMRSVHAGARSIL